VKVSVSLSAISNVGKLLATRLPQNTSVDTGAVLNPMIESTSIPNPVVGVAVS